MKSTQKAISKYNYSIKSKKTGLIIFGLITTFCSTKKEIAHNNTLFTEAKKINLSNCPVDGICSIEVIKNKSIVIKTDDFGSNYYLLEDNNATSVIYYKYDKNYDKNLQDAYYKEEIAFEVPNNVEKLEASDDELKNTKMLYGRLCFCKGQTGFYIITKGKLIYANKNNQTAIDLEFENTKVPQIIKKIKTIIK